MKPLLFGLAACAVSIVSPSPSLASSCAFNGGDGSSSAPYQIANLDQLQCMNTALDAHFILVADIDASPTRSWHGGHGFEPIGVFTGSLDGQNHTITGLSINRTDGVPVGLFGYLAAPAEIKNVRLEDVAVIGGWGAAGGLAGKAIFSVSISHCQTTGSVSAFNDVGGLVGDCLCTIVGCHSSCKVKGWSYVGGLVGNYLQGELSSSYATGDVTASNPITDVGEVGGLVGRGGPHVVDCFATGLVTGGTPMDGVGGLIGILSGDDAGPVSRCYSSGRVWRGTSHVGGLIGGKTSASSRVELSVWDVETSRQDTSAGGVGLTTKQMKDRATYGDFWDFAHTWDMISYLTYPFLQGDNAYFIPYGGGCAGPLYAPGLAARGGPNPLEVLIQVSQGAPSGLGALFVSPTRIDGSCLLFGPPFFGPYPFSLDHNGEAKLSASVLGTTPGDRLVLQFLGLEAPDVWDTSNGLQIVFP